MNYRTTCPHCASVFRLGTDQLEAAQGWVQCSVCGSAFNAQPSLLMEDGSPVPVAEPEPVAAPPIPEIAPPAKDAIGETAENAHIEAAPEQTVSGADDPGHQLPQGIVQRETSLDLPSIILIDPDASVSDDPGPMPHIQAPAYPSNQTTYGSTYPPAPSAFTPPAPRVSTPVSPTTRTEYANRLSGAARVAPVEPRRSHTWIWVLASLLLLTALLAQAAYFLRDTLVNRLPETRPAIEHACEVLGCTLSLPQDLALLQIVGSDLQTEASGRLKLTLTLGNRASHVQAWPVLVLTLTDQRNRPLARRSFAPSEYLDDTQRIAAGIAPRSEQALSLPLNVRNLAPMGFGLRLTY